MFEITTHSGLKLQWHCQYRQTNMEERCPEHLPTPTIVDVFRRDVSFVSVSLHSSLPYPSIRHGGQRWSCLNAHMHLYKAYTLMFSEICVFLALKFRQLGSIIDRLSELFMLYLCSFPRSGSRVLGNSRCLYCGNFSEPTLRRPLFTVSPQHHHAVRWQTASGLSRVFKMKQPWKKINYFCSYFPWWLECFFF